MNPIPLPQRVLRDTVDRALAEDLGHGDLSLAAAPSKQEIEALLVTREEGVLCGQPFAQEVFEQLGGVSCHWQKREGAYLAPDEEIARFHGSMASLLSGERTALNFLQTLSGTATATAAMVAAVAGTGVRILDTRKTLPGLRPAQKYAVRVGGGYNHRHGLYDGILIKENHIMGAGGLEEAIAASQAQVAHMVPIQVEVEDLEQFRQALASGIKAVLLDNIPPADLAQAAAERPSGTLLEASGNIDLANVREIAETGVDAVSVGALTRDPIGIDFSLRFQSTVPKA